MTGYPPRAVGGSLGATAARSLILSYNCSYRGKERTLGRLFRLSLWGGVGFWSFGERRTYASKFPPRASITAPCDRGEAQQVHQLGRHLPNGG